MWYTKLSEKNDSNTSVDIPVPEKLMKILTKLKNHGMDSLIVGGAVRDALMGISPKDIDVEVYNASYQELESILNSIGGLAVDSVGKSFGIVKVRDRDGEEFDFSIPRRESKTGVGHQGFDVEFDTSITPKEAASRRDFTINSLAYDPFSKKVIDFFGGINDLQNKILKHTSSQFSEDPLRVLRGLQFASRFGFTLDPSTAQLAHSIVDQHNTISKERIEREWDKLIQKGKNPGQAIKYLLDTGWIEHYPEIKDIVGIPQTPKWHPEGEVDAHTAHVMNAAAEIADREGLSGDDRAVLIYAALTHDFAKAHTTEYQKKNGEWVWTAHGHEKAGGPIARQFLQRIGVKKQIIDRVVPLVENHLAHLTIKPKFIPRLAHDLYPATVQELAWLIEADHSGRPPLPKELPSEAHSMLEYAKSQNLHRGKPEPLIKWQDLIDHKIDVLKPHPMIDNIGNTKVVPLGRILMDQAYAQQLKGAINNRSDALRWLRKVAQSYALLIKGNHPIFERMGISGPKIGEALSSLYDAQLRGEINSPEDAELWIAENY